MLPVIQGLAVAAQDQVRRPLRPRPEPIDRVAAYGSIDEAVRAYPVLVDREEVDEAEGLFRGLIAAGAHPAVLRHTLLTAVTDHFLAYGHSMIFVQKAFDRQPDRLVRGRRRARRWCRNGLRHPVRQAPLHAGVPAGVQAPRRRPGKGPGAPPPVFDQTGYGRALTDGSPHDALAALAAALDGGADEGRDRRHRPGRGRTAGQVRHRAGPRRHQRVGLDRRHPHAHLSRRPAPGLVGGPVTAGAARPVPRRRFVHGTAEFDTRELTCNEPAGEGASAPSDADS